MQIENSILPYGYIYKITNPINNKCYIGQTLSEPQKRWLFYKNLRCRDQPKFYNALKKYGPESFIYEQLDTAPDQVVIDYLEDFYIQCFDSIKNGYNCKEGGANGKHSEETCKKKSDALKRWYAIHGTESKRGKNNAMYGRKQSKRSIEASIIRNKGRKLPPEHYKALLASHTGTHHSEKTKEKIRIANIGRKHTQETKDKISRIKKQQLSNKNTIRDIHWFFLVVLQSLVSVLVLR